MEQQAEASAIAALLWLGRQGCQERLIELRVFGLLALKSVCDFFHQWAVRHAAILKHAETKSFQDKLKKRRWLFFIADRSGRKDPFA